MEFFIFYNIEKKIAFTFAHKITKLKFAFAKKI
jgi:hypothetical protein